MRLIVQFLRINAKPNAYKKLPLADTLHLKVLHFLQSVDEGISSSLLWKANEVSISSRKQVSYFAFIYMRVKLAYFMFTRPTCQNEKAHSMCPVMLSGHNVRPEMQACLSKPPFRWCWNWHALLLGPKKNATGDQCWMLLCVSHSKWNRNHSSCGRSSWSPVDMTIACVGCFRKILSLRQRLTMALIFVVTLYKDVVLCIIHISCAYHSYTIGTLQPHSSNVPICLDAVSSCVTGEEIRSNTRKNKSAILPW